MGVEAEAAAVVEEVEDEGVETAVGDGGEGGEGRQAVENSMVKRKE